MKYETLGYEIWKQERMYLSKTWQLEILLCSWWCWWYQWWQIPVLVWGSGDVDVDDDDVDVDDDADNDDLYWYEVVVVSSFLKCLKNQTALLRHKRLVWSLREAKVEKCYCCWPLHWGSGLEDHPKGLENGFENWRWRFGQAMLMIAKRGWGESETPSSWLR